jgi:hypothetical protein
MSRLGSALNISESIRYKTFQLGSNTFKVKVPLTTELEQMTERYLAVDESLLKDRLEKMTVAIRASGQENVEITEDDVIVDGKSSKETVKSIIQMEQRITEYVKLLVPANGEINDLTYAEIEEVFPLQIQLELLENIIDAIQPGYKDAQKN